MREWWFSTKIKTRLAWLEYLFISFECRFRGLRLRHFISQELKHFLRCVPLGHLLTRSHSFCRLAAHCHLYQKTCGTKTNSWAVDKQRQRVSYASGAVDSPAWQTPCAEVDLSLSPCCTLALSPFWPAGSEPGGWWGSFPDRILGWSAAVGVTG